MKPTSASPGAGALSASLREARRAHHLGLRELARILELDAQMLSQWERRTRVPPVEVVARILGICKRASGRILYLAKHAKEPNWLDSNPADLPQLSPRSCTSSPVHGRSFTWSTITRVASLR